MAKYHNKETTVEIGKNIRELREKNHFLIEDIAQRTGFARNTISAIESGVDTDTSHLVEIAKAIGVHPMEIFNIPFEIKSRYPPSPQRIAKTQLTARINKLSKDSSFFDQPRLVADVVKYLNEEQKIDADPIHTSVVLKRLVKNGKLQYSKKGRKNSYVISKKD